ncbi:MAG: AAA family ATPase [Steroidobacteraceae bacterium]
MSLVERALNKLKAAQPSPAPRSVSPAPVRVGRVVDVQRQVTQSDELPQPRLTIGNGIRTVRIDHEALRTSGFLPPERHERELAHQFRTIKRPLIRHAFPADSSGFGLSRSTGRSIMVSSALPGEGKTFTAINLALSLAMEKDYAVLLVDGDVAKPNVSQIFGAAGEPGLLDVLTDPSRQVESVVLSTDTPRLSLLPAGTRSEQATELLASARMRQVLGNLERLDPHLLIVVDSPPVLLTSESRVLAGLFEQVLLVVRAGATQQQAVLDALAAIGEKPGLRLILNQATHVGPAGNYYGYGYGYGYLPGETGATTQAGKS